MRPQNGFGYTLTLNADGSGTLTTDGYGDTVCGSNDTRSVLALTVGIVASSSTSPPVYEITWTQQGISNMPLNQRGLAYLRKSSKTCDGSAFQVNVASPSKCFFSGPYYDLRSVAGQNMYVDETSDSNAPVAIRAIDKSYYYVKLSQ